MPFYRVVLKVGTTVEVYSSSHRSIATSLASRQFLPTIHNECLACFDLRRLPSLQGYSTGLDMGGLTNIWAATVTAYYLVPRQNGGTSQSKSA